MPRVAARAPTEPTKPGKRPRGSSPWLLWTCAALGALGCDDCGRKRPYTPFVAESALPTTAQLPVASTTPPMASSLPPSQVLMEARSLEPPVGRFVSEGRTHDLPRNSVAEWLLERDFDHDGQLDALVWTKLEKPDPNSSKPLGELWLFPHRGDPKPLVVLPGFIPSGPECTIKSRLRGLVSDMAFLELTASCQNSLPQRAPVGAKLLLAPASATPVVLGLRVAQTAPGETLEVTPSLIDRDNDGRGDPALEFALAVTDPPGRAKVALGWLDRAAGLSVDDAYFVQSVETQLTGWTSRVTTKARAQGLESELGAYRRLLATLCQQAGTPRVWDLQGDGIRCNLPNALNERLGRIDVEQALVRGDWGSALHAYAETGRFLGGIALVEREALRKRFDKYFTVVRTNLPVAVTTRPKPKPPTVRYSPLRFEQDDSLLVQSAENKLERVQLDGTTETVDLEAAVPWSLDVTSSNGRQWTGVVPACDRSELLLSFTTRDRQVALEPIPLLAPRPGVCRSAAAWSIAIAPIAFNQDLPLAILDGVCVGPIGAGACRTPQLLGPVIPGAPRSPDGKRLVSLSALGPIVYGGKKPERWENSAFASPPLSDCVVANEARALACVQADKLLLVTRSTPAP